MKAIAVIALALAFTASAATPRLRPDNIDRVIKAMTIEEKADLIVGSRMYHRDSTAAPHIQKSWDIAPGAAGLINPVPRVGIPAAVLSDGPAGCGILPVEGYPEYFCTHFPIASLLSASFDTTLVADVARAIATESKEHGVDILLAPAVNIHRHPLCGRNYEYFSEDPMLAGKMAAAYVNGAQSTGIGTSVKHFAVNNQETNRMNNDAIVSPRALREIYLRPFEIAVKEASPWTIMSSYNRVNGPYASESQELASILFDEWGYDGVVMTDWWGGYDAAAQLRARNSLLEPGTKDQWQRIVDATKDGTLPMEVVDDNVRRILRLILRTPRYKGYRYSDNPPLEEHARLTRRSATDGMVLLKNDRSTLPVDPRKSSAAGSGKVALFGNVSYDFFSGGTGSGDIHRPYVVSLLDGLKNHGFEVDPTVAAIHRAHHTPSEHGEQKRTEEIALDTAVIVAAAEANPLAVVTIGRISGEYIDRTSADFFLTPAEYKLLKDVSRIFRRAGGRVVVVLNVGGVVETASWRDLADAILLAWQGGQEGGNSVADILTGEVNPSGKLPMTFPITLSDHASTLNFPVDQAIDRRWSVKVGERTPNDTVYPTPIDPRWTVRPELNGNLKNVDYTVYDEDIYVGYRWFDTKGIDVAYPFGYGLSYTTFEYGKPRLTAQSPEAISVAVDVTNTGKVAGREVVQLYVEAPKGKLDKPSHELKTFAKTRLLAPGETETITLTIDPEYLASFDSEAGKWVTDNGTYRFVVAASSRDPRGSVSVEL